MRPVISILRQLIEPAETLVVAAVGGVGFAWLGLPAGLVSGAVLAVAALALMGRRAHIPVPIARACYITVGIMLGTVVTPKTLMGVAIWPASVALLAAAAVAMIVATTSYLRIVHRWSLLSALMGASPGSMAQVIALSTELGADLRAIAIVQTMRVLLLTTALPAGLAFFGLVVPGVPLAQVATTTPSSPLELVVLVAISAAVALGLARLRFPSGLIFGAMAGSGILHGTGLISSVLPWWVGSAAVLVLGAVVGSRFANTTFRMLLSHLGAAFGSFAVSLLVATLFAAAVVTLFAFPIANVVIAFAPGAQDTMMVLALSLHLDPVYVGAHHIARFIIVTLTVAIAARRIVKDAPDHGRDPLL